MIEGVRIHGKVCNLSDEVYVLTFETRWHSYQGLRVRLCSGVDGHPEPGYHFEPGWVTVVLVDVEEAARRVLSNTTDEMFRHMIERCGAESFVSGCFGVRWEEVVPAATAWDHLLLDEDP